MQKNEDMSKENTEMEELLNQKGIEANQNVKNARAAQSLGPNEDQFKLQNVQNQLLERQFQKKQEELEEKIRVQQTLVAGIEFNEEDLTLYKKAADSSETGPENPCLKCVRSCWGVVDKYAPLGQRVKILEKRFDKSTGSFFVTYRFLNNLAVINLLFYLLLLTRHIYAYNPPQGSWGTLFGTSFLPKAVLYTAFGPRELQKTQAQIDEANLEQTLCVEKDCNQKELLDKAQGMSVWTQDKRDEC